MNRNHLKIIACLSMLIDHIGYVLFPQLEFLRIVGRIAMPLFAFFIGEGCLHTRDKKKYFLRLFCLAFICQGVYLAESYLTRSGNGFYLNILFTFSFSIILCSAFLRFKEKRSAGSGAVFVLTAIVFLLLDLFFDRISSQQIIKVTLDYGFVGICLPLFAVISEDKKKKLLFFTAGLFLVAWELYGLFTAFFVFAMIPALLLCFYNGQGGKRNMKYFFYLFYPLHLAVIYGLNWLMNII